LADEVRQRGHRHLNDHLDDGSNSLAAALAEGLRQAQARLDALPADSARRAAFQDRLLAITNAAKHDLRVAARRLEAFLAELDGS
jgi:hypothetical protein